MSYLALYRKYRPCSFEEVAGQKHIIKILENAVKNNKLSHAYLFSGPRGTGKTTMAKIIAKVINCESPNGFVACDKCLSCEAFNSKNNPDVIEMDAASNNGVDEIREIRNKINLMPTISKYKVYIIDEVHMLSGGAFNALLKTLEEPPHHVIFILATTEFYKVPETIVSRCQCFEFSRIDEEAIFDRLKYIADKEKIKIDEEALRLIAKYSDGGLRDAIGFLDKLSSFSTSLITATDFYDLRGIALKEEIGSMVSYMLSGDVNNLLNIYYKLVNEGKNVLLLAEDIINYVKNMIIQDLDNGENANNLYEIIEILQKTMTDMKTAGSQKLILEIALLKILNIVNKNNNIANEKNISREIIRYQKCDDITNNVTNDDKGDKTSIKNDKIGKTEMKKTFDFSIIINNAFALADKNLLNEMKIKWSLFSDYLHNKEFSGVVSYLLDGNIRVAGDKDVIVSVMYDSIVSNAALNLDKIKTLFNLVMGKLYSIAFVTEDEWQDLKKQFIEDKKNGKKYSYIDENVENKATNSDIIKEEDTSIKNDSDFVNEAISLFGEDVVQVD